MARPVGLRPSAASSRSCGSPLSAATTAAGLLVFCLADRPALAVLGLFVCGAGIVRRYPASLATTIGGAPGHQDRAKAPTPLLGGGLVTAGAPHPLGRLAHHQGLGKAFAVEPVLFGTAVQLLLAALGAGGSSA